jgi:uncharacterized protein YrzB (UPF0473 family)
MSNSINLKNEFSPISLHDGEGQEKFVIVLKVESTYPHASSWYFLSTDPRNPETTEQNQIKIFDSIEEATADLRQIKCWLNYPDAFIHAVTLQTVVSIWSDWTRPSKQ